MGCISTPMPNHLSTCLSLPFHHIRVVRMKGKEQCGDGEQRGNHTTNKRNKEQHHRIKEEEMELDHIALIVSKEENLSFYEKLGFKENNRIERGYDTVVFMENNSIVLEIFIDPNHPARVSGPEALGLRHIAFVVESLEEVTRDVECEEIRTDWFGRRFTFTKDPDGQPIELKEKCKEHHKRCDDKEGNHRDVARK